METLSIKPPTPETRTLNLGTTNPFEQQVSPSEHPLLPRMHNPKSFPKPLTLNPKPNGNRNRT